MSGLSTSGSISLGCALVAGRNRVPRPAAGNTALRTFADITTPVCFYSGARATAFSWKTPPDPDRALGPVHGLCKSGGRARGAGRRIHVHHGKHTGCIQ